MIYCHTVAFITIRAFLTGQWFNARITTTISMVLATAKLRADYIIHLDCCQLKNIEMTSWCLNATAAVDCNRFRLLQDSLHNSGQSDTNFLVSSVLKTSFSDEHSNIQIVVVLIQYLVSCCHCPLMLQQQCHWEQWSLLSRFRTEQGHCGACRRKWRLTDTDLCPCSETPTTSHIVESCPLTKLNGGLSRLHSADEDAVSWLTNYG